MRKLMAYLCSALLAAVVPSMVVATLVCVIFREAGALVLRAFPFYFVLAFIVAFAHTLVIGIPYALLLGRLGRFKLVPMMIGGFAASVLLDAAFWAWDFYQRHDDILRFGASHGYADWWARFGVMLAYGVLGALAAATFHCVFGRILPEKMHVDVAWGTSANFDQEPVGASTSGIAPQSDR